MHLFHCTELSTEEIELSEDEAHHAASVLRLKVGERIGILDGRGARVEAELIEVGKRAVIARSVSRHLDPPERNARIRLAIAPTKQNDRLEWFVEKAVEVGVDRIDLVLTQRCERTRLRLDRLHRVAISAMKQSQRSWLPTIEGPFRSEQLLAMDLPAQRYFGYCTGEHSPLMKVYDKAQDALILIGPEGDLTPLEAEQLLEKGFVAVSLGHARLRTETAALAACTWMSLTQQIG
ncbi:MAG: RsmE family RNA methyltransferase [Flavobacteriales bacterium]|nr:16S rRNA (uracil(1498)-N(3))-methyltransferase [Flavobacteriales bacterium]